MKKKRLISLFLMVIMTLAFTSSAFADVNMGSGDGTGWGDGTGDNVWSLHTENGTAIQAPEGLRITVYDAESGAKVFNTIDIVPPIKPCQNQAAYFVKGALKKEAILEWFNCKDFKCERTLCSSSSFDCADALLPTERFKSLFTSSSGLYSGA